MPTPAELDVLRGLLTRLRRLDGARRGESIRSANWNELVSVVVDLAELVLSADDHAQEVPRHQHVGQVQLSWFTPSVRRLVESGGTTGIRDWLKEDPRRFFDRITKRLDEIDDTVTTTRSLVATVRGRDTVRESELNRLRTKVDGIADSNQDVVTLRETLVGLSGEVKKVAEVGAGLEVDGQRVNLADLARRIAKIENLKSVLEDYDAKRDAQLAELETKLVTEERLTQALNDRRARVNDATVTDITRRVNAKVETTFATSLSDLRKDVEKSTDDRLRGIDVTVAAKVAETTKDLVVDTVDSLVSDARIKAFVAAEAATASAPALRRADAVNEELRALLKDRDEEFAGRVTEIVDNRVGDVVARDTASLVGRIEALDRRVERDASLLDEQKLRIAVVERDVSAGLSAASEDRKKRSTALLKTLKAVDESRTKELAVLKAQIQRKLDSPAGGGGATFDRSVPTSELLARRNIAETLRRSDVRLTGGGGQ